MKMKELAALGIVLLTGCSNPFATTGLFHSNDYLPIEKGSHWYYKYSDPEIEGNNGIQEMEIVEYISGGKIPLFTIADPFRLDFGKCARTPEKLIGNYARKYPMELPWPPQEGKTWSYKFDANANDNYDMKYADKTQDVEVPYGKFSGTQCLIFSKDGKDLRKYYFAAGVGIVKAEERIDAAKSFCTHELVNYRLGQDPVPVLGNTTSSN